MALKFTVKCVLLISSLLTIPLSAQTCPQPITLRQESCPVGSVVSCTTGGSSIGGTLTWQQLDRDILNTVGLCNGPGLYTWPAPAAGILTSNGLGTISLNSVTLTPTSNGGPFRMFATGSTLIGATNQGLRHALFSLFDTNTSSLQNTVIGINFIQQSGVGTIQRTGIDIRGYTQPDNGGDTSLLLGVQTGGGCGLCVYQLPGMRPSGYTNYESTPQGAIEAGTGAQNFAIMGVSGSQLGGATSNASTAILARVDNAASRGLVIFPNDNTFDTRDALVIGYPQINATPVNQTYSINMAGNVRMMNNANDASDQSITFFKSRAGGSVNTNETLGDIFWSQTNSSNTEKAVGLLRVLASDKTAGSEDGDFVFYTVANGAAMAEKARLSSAGTWTVPKIGIGTSAPDSLLTISANTNTLPSPPTGTLLHIGNVDSTATRLGMQAFAASPSFDLTRANGTASAMSSIGGSQEVIGQISGFGHDGTSITSTSRVNLQFITDGAWSSGSTPTAFRINTTLSGAAASRSVFVVDSSGHVLTSDSSSPSITCTGTGTSPTAPTIAGTDVNFTATISTGTGAPGSTGTCTITFAHAFLTNSPPMVCMLVKGGSTWGNGATIQLTTESVSAPVLTWTNLVGGVATALTVSSSYKFNCLVMGR